MGEAKEVISKSVRNLNSPNLEDENSDPTKLKNPIVKLSDSYKGHKDIINGVSIHPTEPVFASGSGDSTIRIYDYELKD